MVTPPNSHANLRCVFLTSACLAAVGFWGVFKVFAPYEGAFNPLADGAVADFNPDNESSYGWGNLSCFPHLYEPLMSQILLSPTRLTSSRRPDYRRVF